MPDSSKYTSKLSGSHVLILGGSSGLGFGLAEACIEFGAHVIISSSNTTRIESAISKIKSTYPSKSSNIHGLPTSLSNPATLENELESVLRNAIAKLNTNSKLDHIVFTAADSLACIPLSEMNMQNVPQAAQLRFFAPLLLAKFLSRYLDRSYRSSYTITSGCISERPVEGWSVVGAYAGGHHAMVRNVALELKPIRVNGVSPGVVDTAMWRMGEEEQEKFMADMGGKLATGRVGQVEDVVESFLVTLKDRNMTGSVVRTDSGALFM